MTGDPIDAASFQHQERESWDSVSAGWARWFDTFETGAQSLNERLVEMVGAEPGHRILDVATGIGEPAATAARRVGETGHVLAIDLSPQMLELGRERAERLGLTNLEFAERDAEQLGAAEPPFDAALCRWGLMLMLRPVVVAQAIRDVLKPGGLLAAAVWGTPGEVPFLSTPQRVIREMFDLPPADPEEPGPCRLGGAGMLEAVLGEAGFDEIEVEDRTVTLSFASAGEYVTFLGDMSSSLRKRVADLSQEHRDAVLAAIEVAASDFGASGGGIEFHNRVICAVGRRP